MQFCGERLRCFDIESADPAENNLEATRAVTKLFQRAFNTYSVLVSQLCSPRMSNSNSDVNDATCGVPERTSDLIEHAPDVGDSTPNVAEHTSDVSDPISNVTEHSSDVSDPTSDGSDPVSEASEHTSDVPKHTSDVDDPTSNVAKDTSKVIEHISNAGDSTSKVSKSKKPVDNDDLKKVVARGIRGVVKWFSARNRGLPLSCSKHRGLYFQTTDSSVAATLGKLSLHIYKPWLVLDRTFSCM